MAMKKILAGLMLGCLLVAGAATSEAAMTYEQALKYQGLNSEEVFISNDKVKDAYGQKNIKRYFSLLNKNGLAHSGNTILGVGDYTFINLLINYGIANMNEEPFAYIRWIAHLAGAPDRGYEPKTMNIAFSDGFIKTFSLQGWEYRGQIINGMFANSWAHLYDGRVRLNDFDLYELSQHGQIVAISMDDGNGGIKHFFYSGDKDINSKAKLNRGIYHAMKILQVDEQAVIAKKAERDRLAEEERLAKLRAEIEKEIKADAEREAMKKAIQAEIAAKEKAKQGN
ncbi:hypothetical protein [Anaerospora hongkongensis]|uniref:hypothetical protein n=1 Tax=Anaerospora hongkongensis TaxID=244830 RepID=UPI002FD9FC99